MALHHILGNLCVLLLIYKANAYEFKIGGPGNWSVPSDPNSNTYNQWAERSRFQIGDTLVFDYPADKDSVLQVNKDDYTNCNTASPLEKHSEGHTVFKFNHSGPFYFISGVEANCKNNEKVVVVVMANRSSGNNSTAASPPSPSANSPSTTQSSPGSVEINPTPAPESHESPKKNAGSVILAGVVSSVVGAVVGFYVLLF